MNTGRQIHCWLIISIIWTKPFPSDTQKCKLNSFWKRLLKTHGLAAFLFLYFLFFCKKYVVFLYECFLKHKYGVQFVVVSVGHSFSPYNLFFWITNIRHYLIRLDYLSLQTLFCSHTDFLILFTHLEDVSLGRLYGALALYGRIGLWS